MQRIVLAYSGGLDTSVIMRWLIETYQCEVVAYVADLGQEEDLDAVHAKAIQTGAAKVEVEDVREEFVRDFVFPALRGNAVYEGTYLLGTSLARPIIAKKQLEAARRLGAEAVSHGATGKGNDQVRFELTYLALQPNIKIIAPWREWDLNSRQELMAYAKQHGIPVPTTKAKPYSIDRTLLPCSYAGGLLEDPWREPEESMFTMTTSPEQAPDSPRYVEIEFVQGNPTTVDGEALTPAALLGRLNRIGGEHGVGRVDMVENRYVGIKCRGVYETPGGTLLHHAHRALESITMDREVMHLRDGLIPKYAELLYYGYWYAPEREMLQAAIDQSQRTVTGRVRLKLYKGSCWVVGRRAEKGLYHQD